MMFLAIIAVVLLAAVALDAILDVIAGLIP